MQKKNLFSFHFQVHVTSPSLMAKLLKSREQNKRFQSFLCRDGVSSPSLMAKLLKSRAQNKETRFFFCHQKDFDLGSHAFLHENHHQR